MSKHQTKQHAVHGRLDIIYSFFLNSIKLKWETLQLQLSSVLSPPHIDGIIYSDHHSYLPAGLQRSLEPWRQAERSCSCFSQNKKNFPKHWSKVHLEAEVHTWGHHHHHPLPSLHSQPCTYAHKHPHLVDRERTDDGDLLISESFYQLNPKIMWVQMAGDPEIQGPGSLTKWLGMKREIKRGERGRVFIRFMSSRSCWRVGEFPRTLNCSPGRNQPLLPDPDS